MAATDLDEESWLYGEDTATSKSDGGVNEKQLGNKGRSRSPLLDDLDDVIVNAEMKQRTNKIVSVSSSLQPKATTPSEDAKTPVEDEDGVFDTEKREGEGEEKAVGEGEEEEEEESDSDDSDVQIVIGPIENHPVPFYPGRLPSTSNAVLTGPKKVDVEAVPTIGGQSIFEIDLDSADKPWRLPGADITDYFNYGFTEETWRLYCEKQRRTKTEVAQLNKIAVHTTRISTLQRSGMVTAFSTIPSITGSSLPPPPIHHFSLQHHGLLPPTLLPPPPLPHLPHGMLPPVLPEAPSSSQDLSVGAQGDHEDRNKTPDPANEKEEGSDGRATPGVDQETPEVLPHSGKVPLLPPPPTSLSMPPFSMPPPIRSNMSGAPDVTNAMAAMLSGFRQPEHHFPGFLPPPGFPPPFHPQLPGGDFRPRVPPFPGGPPPFPMLPGGHLDVPGLLPPPLDERGLPMHPDLGLPGGTWDPSMGPPELFDMMTRREEYARGTRSPSRSGSSGRSRSRSRSSSYDDRGRRRRDKRLRRHSRSRSHSRDRDRDRHRSSRRTHHSNHHRSERHDRDRDRERDREREREKERERDRRRREERSRRERSRRHRSSSRDREEDRGSAGGSRSTRDRKTKEPPPPRDERSHSQTPS